MTVTPSNLLFWLPILPLIGAITVALFPARQTRSAGIVSLGVTLLLLTIALSFKPVILPWRLTSSLPILTNTHLWIPDFNLSYRTAVDGYSGWLILITILSAIICILTLLLESPARATKDRYAVILAALASALGIFIAKDLLTFLFAWGIWTIIPFCLQPNQTKQKKNSGMAKFFLFHLLSLLMISAALALAHFSALKQSGIHGLDIDSLSKISIPTNIQKWVLLFLFPGIAIRLPLFPLHGWLPDILDEMPTEFSAFLIASGSASATYALITICLPLCPNIIIESNRYFIFAANVSMVYGALVALMNPHILQRIGFTIVSYSGFFLMGIFALNGTALLGTALTSSLFLLTTVVLFLTTGWISRQAHSTLLQDLGGIWKKSPVMAGIFLLAALAWVGVPGLCLFPGIFLIIGGTLMSQPAWAAVAIATFLILAAGMLWMFQRVFTGPMSPAVEQFAANEDIAPGRVMIPVTALIIWFGFFPQYMIHSMNDPVDTVTQYMQSHRIFMKTQPEMSPLEHFLRMNRSDDEAVHP